MRLAARWASRFGFASLPQTRPAHLRADERRRAEWVRAFMGTPPLIMLEEPMRGVYDQQQLALVGALDEVRYAGSAVLWLTSGAAPGACRVTSELRLDDTGQGGGEGGGDDETV